jgi:hypothetical protein
MVRVEVVARGVGECPTHGVVSFERKAQRGV